MTTLKSGKQSPMTAAVKAERERDKVEAVRDYEAERLATQANMARLRALRLAKERADKRLPTKQRPAKRKAAG
jgi:hypothetical protein